MIVGDRGGENHLLIEWIGLFAILFGIDDCGMSLQYLAAEPLVLVFTR